LTWSTCLRLSCHRWVLGAGCWVLLQAELSGVLV
jgi:hypothetical protein